MVKINHKSKRMPAKTRYRIEKRVRDHNKKIKKQAKGTDKKKRNKKKNMVIPNKYPFKEELLQMAEKQKQAELEAKQKKKQEKKKKLQKDAKKPEDVRRTVDDLLKEAQKKQQQFDKLQSVLKAKSPFDYSASEKDKETSMKTFYKEFRKVVEAADVIIEVLDARDPTGSRCPQAEEMIMSSGKKKLILLLNKIDLVPKENVQAWLKYLRSLHPTVAFKSSTQNQNEKLSQSSVPVNLANQNLLTSAKCLGADILLKLLNNYTRVNDIKQTITVGIIGLPNVGKSSVINSLKRSHACMIGSVPGLTRCMQEVKLDKHIKLLDSPGIVMSKDEDAASLALKNCIRIESLDDPLAPIDLLLKRCHHEQLIVRYRISTFKDSSEFLSQVAKRCGKMKKNGIPDIKKAAQMVLNDWTSGKLTYYTMPPEPKKVLETKLVTELGPLLDIDSLLKDDEDELFNEIDDTKIIVDAVEATSTQPTQADFNKLEMESDDDDDDDDDDESKENENEVKIRSDVVLNKKVQKKNKKALKEEKDDMDASNGLKRKAAQEDDDDDDEEDDNVEKEVYSTEDIPRTRKMNKLEAKKKLKKFRRNDKMYSNLGDMLNNFNLDASKSKELYDFKTDFKS